MSQTILAPSPQLTASVQFSTSWTITNNSGIDLVVIDAFAGQADPAVQLYDQTLSLLKTSDNQTSVKNGTAKTVALPQTHLDENSQPLDYTLLVANAQTLQPIQVVELPVAGDPQSFPATEVTASDVDASKQAQEFTKAITAFPTSSLAADYVTALNTTDETAVAQFFAAQPNYRNVSLGLATAVQTYYNRFPFFLTGYAPAKTYYLYTSDGTDVRFAGSVALENTGGAFGRIEEAVAGFSAMYITTNGANYVDLNYADGQLVDDPNSDSPDYCLQGLFVLRSDLTKKEEDNDIMTILYGRVNGQPVFGYDVKQQRAKVTPATALLATDAGETPSPGTTDEDKESGFSLDVLIHPQTTKDWLILTAMIVGGWQALGLAGCVAWRLKMYLNRAAMTPEQIAAKKQQIQEQNRQQRQRVLDKIGEGGELLIDQAATLTQIRQQADIAFLNDNKLKIKDTLRQQRQMCEIISDLASPTSLKLIQARMDIIDGALPEMDDTTLFVSDKMKNILKGLNDNMVELASIYTKFSRSLQRGEQRAFEDHQRIVDDVTTRLTKNEEIREDLAENEYREIPELPEIIER